MIIEKPDQPQKRPRSNPEMRLQAECVQMAWNDFPQTRRLLFHIANELDRPDANAMIGARRRAEGIIRGVSDLILMIPRGKYHALCIEMKTESGVQSRYQKDWQGLVEAQGYRYEVCRSKEQFKEILEGYLSLPIPR
jgi:hypothetical protein